jgi:hypothetical protein
MAKTRAEKAEDKKLLMRVRERSKIMMDADKTNRQLAIEDMRFLRVPGAQWDEITKKERGADRPMYEFNKLNITAKRVINEMRANRPMGKVRAAEDGDVPTADIMEGITRNIVANADFDTVTDYAAEYQVGAGMGAWRVTLDYVPGTFEQVIDIDPLINPFCLYADPGCKDLLKRDAEDWWYTDKISKASFKKRWPKAEPVNLDEGSFDDDGDWEDEDSVRIGEYWYKEPYEAAIQLLSDGSVIDKFDEDENPITPPEGVSVVKERLEKRNKIMMCIVSGNAILEGPKEWAGDEHPWVMVYGEYIVIEGKVYWNGITRSGKDAQRAYNYSRTTAIETVALAPQDKPWLTPEQISGLEDHYAEAHKKNYPFYLYRTDPKAPGPPVRLGGATVPAALVQEVQIASEDIKAVTGIYDASLGAQSNETSGRAINARQRQGEIATFNYQDNMGKGVKRTWEILVNLIPKVIDTEQVVRILGVDGKEKYETVNKRDPMTGKIINDLSKGRFDTVITVGPSYATRRMEAAEVYAQMATGDQGLMLSAGDLVYKALDLPYSQEIAERRALLLPPPVQQALTQGKALPPEVQAALAQVQQAQQEVQQHGQLVQAAEQELKELDAKVKGDAASAKLAQAQIKAMEAELQAKLDLERSDLALAQQKVDSAQQLLAKTTENSILKIKLAQKEAEHALTESIHHHTDTVRAVEGAVSDGAQTLTDKHREVTQAVKDGAASLKDQKTQMKIEQMQSDHKNELREARTEQPSSE